jgi:predicted O-methyltransferase YrrM
MSTPELWTRVDEYFSTCLLPDDPTLEEVLRTANAAGLPPIAVSPNQGKLLEILIRLAGARAVLEIGTLAGYSTICMARGLPPGGQLVTIEIDPRHAQVAAANIASSGLGNVVELILGSALDVLPRLVSQRAVFDFIFIDADKQSIPQYFEWALELSRPGSVIIVDNVVRDGKVIADDPDDAASLGVRKFVEMLSKNSAVSATAIQMVGIKGYDGFAVVRRHA